MLAAILLTQWFTSSYSEANSSTALSQFNDRHIASIRSDVERWKDGTAALAASDEVVELMSQFSQYRLRQTQSSLIESGVAGLPTIQLDEPLPFQRFVDWLNNGRETISSGVRGIELIGSDGTKLGKSIDANWKPSDPSVVFKAMKQKSVSLDKLFKDSRGDWHLPVIAPIWSQQGRLLGALITEYTVAEAFQSVNAIEAEAGAWYATVLMPSGNSALTLSTSRPGFQLEAETASAVRKPSGEITTVDINGEAFLQSLTATGVEDWVLATRLNIQEQNGLLGRIQTITLIALLLTAVLFAAGWWFVVRTFNQRLLAIADASERMLKRDYSVRIEDRTPDKTGRIARHLDQIAGELNENVTVKATVKQRIQQLADQDELTGLYKAECIDDALDQIRDGQTPLPVTIGCVKIHDYDQLKRTHGESLAEQVLVAVAKRIRTVIEPAHMIARRNSEFFIIAGETDQDTGALMATRINNLFTTSFETTVGEMLISCQLGMATTGNRDALTQALNDAENGLSSVYSAAQDTPESDDSNSAGEASAENATKLIEDAIREHRISVDYQPILRLSSGGMPKLEAAEALVRVQDESGEIIPPNILMPQIQNTPSILILDRFMLNHAIAAVNQWVEDKRVTDDFRVSINLSRQTVQSTDIVGFLRTSIIGNGLSPDRIILEISGGTEDINLDILSDIRELGFALAVDDMTLQPSNLEQLANIKPVYAKIDQRRLHTDGADGIDPELQQQLDQLKSGSGVEIVAKSVESAEQIAVIAGSGITLLQGYLFDHPKNGEQFVERWGQVEAANDPANPQRKAS
ncbi:MAG: EAL domain-containing protein [Gammaproteobacteria bacterium]|nr:EAL domain-containing protein [Gammaproteobacteria bacterium]